MPTGMEIDLGGIGKEYAADTCTQAGMLSTFAMLEGQGAEAFLEKQGVRFWCRR